MPFPKGPAKLPSDIAARAYPGQYGTTKGGLGPGSPVPSRAQTLGEAGVVAFPPRYVQPREGRAIYQEAQVTLGPGPANATVAVFTLPVNAVGVLRELLLNINNTVATTDVRWTLLFNDGPVTGYTNLTIFPRAAASVSSSFPAESTFIDVPDRGKIAVRINVLDGGTYQVGVSYRGWFWPKSVEARYPQV